MNAENLINIVLDIVPQYYRVDIGGGQTVTITINGQNYYVNTFRRNTPQLNQLILAIEHSSDTLLNIATGSAILDQEIIEAKIVDFWLRINGYQADWQSLFDYCRKLESRTYENSSIGFTFIIQPDATGDLCLLDGHEHKILDVLAETHFTYFNVCPNWKYIDYNYVPWGKIEHITRYKLVPELVWPFKSIMNRGQCAVTRTKRGDIIIYDKGGLLAAYRKGNWKIYEASSLKNVVVDIISWASSGVPYYIAANLFEICLDLSYRRHGALIIVDNNNRREQCVTNPVSIIEAGRSPIRTALSNRINEIHLGSPNYEKVHKPLVLELASIDGAIIIGPDGYLKAFGAIIGTHSHAVTETGARSTAALSAYYHGMRPIKISADGEITFYHNHGNRNTGESQLAKISFL